MKVEIIKTYRDMPSNMVLFEVSKDKSYVINIPESVYPKFSQAVKKGDIITVRGILKRLNYNIVIV